MKNIITIATLIAAGTALANADTKTFGATRNASVVILFNVTSLRSISATEFSGATETYDFLKFTGTWSDASTGHIGLANNGSSSTHKTGLWGSWSKGSSSAKNTPIGLGEIFTSSTTWGNISAVSAACSFSTPTAETGATTMNVALAIKYADGTASSIFSGSSSAFVFSGKSGFSATGLEWNNTYVSSLVSFDDGFAFASTDAAAAAALAAIPEPSAFGLLAGAGALALVGARRRRR